MWLQRAEHWQPQLPELGPAELSMLIEPLNHNAHAERIVYGSAADILNKMESPKTIHLSCFDLSTDSAPGSSTCTLWRLRRWVAGDGWVSKWSHRRWWTGNWETRSEWSVEWVDLALSKGDHFKGFDKVVLQHKCHWVKNPKGIETGSWKVILTDKGGVANGKNLRWLPT